jgi:CBS domain-containing protein
MKCHELMNTDLRWISGDTMVLDASRLMRDLSLRILLVSAPVPGRDVGVVTERDLTVRVCAEGLDPRTVRIGDVATVELVTCGEGDHLKVAEARMIETQKSRLLVVDDNHQVVGLLSLVEILRGDHGWRALKIANALLSREAAGPHPPLESIHLTPSTPADEEQAANSASVMVGGDHRGSMREFGA